MTREEEAELLTALEAALSRAESAEKLVEKLRSLLTREKNGAQALANRCGEAEAEFAKLKTEISYWQLKYDREKR